MRRGRAEKKAQDHSQEWLCHKKKEGRSAILSLSSAAAPLGARFITERSYRCGISDVDPLPGQIEFEGTALAAALTLAEPDALRLPGLQKGSEKREEEVTTN